MVVVMHNSYVDVFVGICVEIENVGATRGKFG